MAKIEIIVIVMGRPITAIVDADSHEHALELLEAQGYIDGYSPGDKAKARFFREGMQAVFEKPTIVQAAPSIILPGVVGQRAN